jgi:capsule polysaccharide export protein KpsE/RkpR
VLHVEIPRNTKILEISATLPDRKKAQALALYLAQQTVILNRTVSRQADQEVMESAEKQLGESRRRLDQAVAACNRFASREPIEGLSDEIGSEADLKAALMRRITSEQMSLADLTRSGASGGGMPGPKAPAADAAEIEGARARIDSLRSAIRDVEAGIARKQAMLGSRTARMDGLVAERKAAEADLSAAESRLRDVRISAGFRGEQLNIIDPGITPERPSSPNISLNIVAALLAALVFSIGYVTLEFGFRRQAIRPVSAPLRVVGNDD